MVGWWDCNDPSANGVQPANGASLATLVDKSTSGNDFTQATGAAQPTFSASAKNGKGGILLSTTQSMATINPPNNWTFGTSGRSLVMVFAITTTISGANHLILSQGGGGNGNNTFFGHFNAGGAVMGVDSGGSGGFVTYNSSAITINTFYVWEYYCASGTLTASTSTINGTAQGATNHSYTGVTVASSALTIGTSGGITLLEIVACNQLLSNTLQNNLRAYLRGKWAI